MIYPHTVLLHGLMALLSLGSLLYLFYKKKSLKAYTVKLYFNWFFFFSLYNIALVLPLLFINELNWFAAITYVTALLFAGIAAWQAFVLGLMLLGAAETIRFWLSRLYIIGVIAGVLLHFVFFEVPHGTPDGNLVLWYWNPAIALFYTFFMFTAGWTFALAFFRSIFSLPATLLKMRAIFFSLSAFLLPLAALFYFVVPDVTYRYLSFVLVGIAMLSFIMGNVIIGFFIQSKKPLSSVVAQIEPEDR